MEIIRPSVGDIVRFGIFELSLGSGELRKRGLRVALQNQPLRVLAALLERPGDVVSRGALCRRLWPEGTFVDFEHSLNAAVRRLRLALGDNAEIPRFIETVHKRGYRFLAFNSGVASGARVVVARNALTVPETLAPVMYGRSKLAVLPFGPRDGFTDGLTDEAITRLTQTCPATVGVIARTSVERAQRDGGGAADIGRALGADYLVEGYVRREGDLVRISAQLIASQEEIHLCAWTFDRVMIDALSVQAEIAGEIARAVADALSTATRASA